MSVEHLAVVLHHSKARGTDKLVLVGIANHAGDGGSWPSVATLAAYANVSDRCVQKAVDRLIEIGEVKRYVQAGGTRETRDHLRTNRYEILVECPPECDRTPNHRMTPCTRVHPGGEPAFTPPGEPAFTPRVNAGTPEPSVEPSVEPSTAVADLSQKLTPACGTTAPTSENDATQGELVHVDNPEGLPPDVYERSRKFTSKRGQSNPVEWCAAIDDTKAWHEHCQQRGIPIVNGHAATQSMRIMLYDFLTAGYGRDEVRRALSNVGDPWPAKKQLERSLLEARGLRNGNGRQSPDAKVMGTLAMVSAYRDEGR